MAYTETTHTSWGKRLGSSLMGVIFGLALFVAGTGLLYWNEGNFIKTRALIDQAASALVHIENVDKLDSRLEGKLIHATAMAETQSQLQDTQFGVNVKAISLTRYVEYYQWVEHTEKKERDKLGGGKETVTIYTYDKQWVGDPVDSESFKDPDYRGLNSRLAMQVSDHTYYADSVTFGAYRLPTFLVNKMSNDTAIDMQQFNKAGMKVVDNQVYIGNAELPDVGDVRVRFTAVFPSKVSIIAQVNQGSFVPFISPTNQQEFSALAMGVRSADSMIADAHSDNKFWLWGCRIGGIIACIVAWMLLFAPLSALTKVIPPLGSLVGFLSAGIASIIGLLWGVVVIAMSWLRFRPMISGIMLAVAAIVVIWVLYRKKQKLKIVTPPPPPPPIQ
ncbi:TMEM43 family protein [Phocoenobacter skyensis]|uniref:TMEM43 family protein n=2 Tax=Phocoenobacter skyensis TaxID=97481 RepID=A0AAJ6NBU8_9PAST|nr:TMEM43 family protein [Pasteurella skyensis]MDP8173947.1 TMEM43 family protein [Pasteurella skyensis]